MKIAHSHILLSIQSTLLYQFGHHGVISASDSNVLETRDRRQYYICANLTAFTKAVAMRRQ